MHQLSLICTGEGGWVGGGEGIAQKRKEFANKKQRKIPLLKFYKKFQLKQTILAENPPGLHYLRFCDHSKSKAFINFVNIYEQLMYARSHIEFPRE
jgi:hypothetical protein